MPTRSDLRTRSTEARGDGTFVSHARTVAGLTLLSRFAGVARDAVCARVFGAGPLWSAFAFAFVVPNLFRRLFGEGALAAAFLPEYARLIKRNEAAARKFAWLVMAVLGVGLALVTIGSEAALWWVDLRFGGEAHPPRMLAIRLTMVMLPYMPLVCLVAVIGAVLQVHHRFGPTAAAPILLNLCIIAAALLTALAVTNSDHPIVTRLVAPTEAGTTTSSIATPANNAIADPVRVTGVFIVAGSVLVAGILQIAWSLLAMRKTAAWPRASSDHPPNSLTASATGSAAADRDLADPEDDPTVRLRSMLRIMLPMLIGTGVLQINTLIDALIAAYPVAFGDRIFGLAYPLDQAANAILFYSQRLYQFPLGVFGIAIATAIFPAFARTADVESDFTETLRRGLRLTVFIGLPASVGLIAVARPLPAVLLQGGLFEAADVARVATVLIGYAPAIWAYSMIHVLTRAFYAKGDARTPVRVAVSVVGLNVLLNLVLIWFLREAGLAVSTAISATVNCALLLYFIRHHAPRPVDRDVLRSWSRSALATVVMSACLIATEILWRTVLLDRLGNVVGDSAGQPWRAELIRLVLLVGTGVGAYAVTARLANMHELRWLLSRTD
ncbi:MAG: murein biosynthesis integral membrane protein MurJ [Planctomycetota bacterium]